MTKPSVFTRIINGELPCHKIYEDDKVVAILTNHPMTEGHTLIIPKNEIDQIWDMPDEDYDYMWQVSKRIATHIKEVLGSQRIGVVVKGFEVPHVHIHLVPLPNHKAYISLDPTPPPKLVDDTTLAAVAEKLRF